MTIAVDLGRKATKQTNKQTKHTGLLNIGHQEVQLRSSISHNSIHLQVEGFQSLLRSHATLGINCRSAHLFPGHLTLLTGPDANNLISFFCKHLELVW